jgi:hypothetical protein
MGLDMYLCRKGGNKALNAEDLTYEQYTALKPQWEVAYWRKANAIHAWFVEHAGRRGQMRHVPREPGAARGLVKTQILLGYKTVCFFGGTGYDEGTARTGEHEQLNRCSRPKR